MNNEQEEDFMDDCNTRLLEDMPLDSGFDMGLNTDFDLDLCLDF